MVSGSRCSIAICNDGSVYSTGTGSQYGDNGLGAKGVDNISWQRIECLQDIIDCDFGDDFVIFLSSSGRVFSAGRNHHGQLGLGTKEDDDEHILRNPTEIKYFRENNIQIQSIRCRYWGVVALDGNGNVYQWGESLTGGSDLTSPEKIKMKEKVLLIEAGCHHCICKTEKGHFISIGYGSDGECCRDNLYDYSPQIINEWILNRINSKGTKILSAKPCWNSTLILVSNTDGLEEEKEQEEQHAQGPKKETKCNENAPIRVEIHEEEQKSNGDNDAKEMKEQEHEDEDEDDHVEKQFKLFLKKSKTIRYFDKFAENECCNMQSIRYFDDEFLSQDIGMKSKILRKTFLRQCNKMVEQMDEFENNYGITAVVYEQLEKYGVVTIPILCQQAPTPNDLKRKFKITNDYHCELLLKIIQKENGDGGVVIANKNQNNENEEEYQQEGADATAWI